MSRQAALRAAIGMICCSLVIVALSPEAVPADCTTSFVECDCLELPQPSLAPSYSCVGPWQAGDACGGACYDVPAGKIVLDLTAPQCMGLSRIRDHFQLAGITGGPRLFGARLHIVGTVSSPAVLRAELQEATTGLVAMSYSSADSPLDTTLSIPILREPGESFELSAMLRAEPLGAASVTATLEFTDLPSEAKLTSCQGYNLPVPALSSSWGRMKALYR
jgi:hypothetical protein